jgi:hypothetical protein
MEIGKMPHYQWMDEENVVFYTQWNFTQPQRRMKSCHTKVNGWNWRISS